MKKTILILGIICLLVGLSINPSVAVFNSNDDTTPPVTTHSLDPPTPDGGNGWYVSDVNVTLNATDDMSGVKEIQYRIDGGSVWTIPGDYGTFVLDIEKDNLPVEYWAIDNAGNYESYHIFTIDIDKTPPYINCTITPEKKDYKWYITIILIPDDKPSGICRLEIFFDDVVQSFRDSPPWDIFWCSELSYLKSLKLKFGYYDNAGNIAYQEIKAPFNKNNIQQSAHKLLIRSLDHFPLLQHLLDIWRHVLL